LAWLGGIIGKRSASSNSARCPQDTPYKPFLYGLL